MYSSYNFDALENDPQNSYYWQTGFNSDELKTIDEGIKKLKLQKAQTAGNGKDDIRSSQIRWIPQNEEWWWLYNKLSDMIVTANNELWKFDLHSMPEQIQFTEYYATENGHYTWHQDIGPGILSKRKISITVQLSDPSEYDGGVLEMWQGGPQDSAVKAYKGAGSVFIFPSYMMHRVTPVTRGVRKSFVLWVGGSHYR
jgi:PKHD-type hydroxylase|tara:strand:- start:132 stop:725 length:594 start_codon:yes stop_codon:yes gene_type:complete